ncbi:MAG: hypothetical protein ACK5QW_08040 [Cyanobacteriota bacterium]|jgi:hypothetical protein
MAVWRAIPLGFGLVGALAVGWGAAVSAAPQGGAALTVAGASTSPALGDALRPSTANQLALAQHLRLQGVVFYGAWWCPACFKQKNLFGQQAGDQLPYVECEKTDAQRERCERAGVAAYPTWVMGNQRLEGVQSLERLGQWTGFPSAPKP